MSTPTLAELIEIRRAFPPFPEDAARASLSDRFLVPPFSVLDARQGYWQKRKKMWLSLGIKSELGRGETPSTHYSEGAEGHYRANATVTGRALPAMQVQPDGGSEKYARGDGTDRNSAYMFKTEDGYKSLKETGGSGRRMAKAFNIGTDGCKENNWSQEDNVGSGTSIFDPVLCEIAYRWFCPQGGRILDPFAGGSVRGIVAAKLGRAYAGVDLRQEQADANYDQAEAICQDCAADLQWATGDSQHIRDLLPGEYDLVFSCPPYADLERYSDDPRDLSTMDYSQFRRTYTEIICQSCSMLRDDRFACFVVGDVRDRQTGNYRNFVGDTVEAFRVAGLELYNEAILVTSVGSLPIRVGQQFTKYRKLGKTHQQVLVFLKGGAGAASAACGEVDIDDLDMPEPVKDCIAVELNPDNVIVLEIPLIEAALRCDILRGEARNISTPIPRVWYCTTTEDGWSKIQDHEELTYVVGSSAYLHQSVFPGARGPQDTPPLPRKLR